MFFRHYICMSHSCFIEQWHWNIFACMMINKSNLFLYSFRLLVAIVICAPLNTVLITFKLSSTDLCGGHPAIGPMCGFFAYSNKLSASDSLHFLNINLSVFKSLPRNFGFISVFNHHENVFSKLSLLNKSIPSIPYIALS